MSLQELYENIKRTTEATIDAYRKWDLEAIMSTRSDDCVYQFRPLSLKQPAMDNAAYREYYGTQIIPLFTDFKVRGQTSEQAGKDQSCANDVVILQANIENVVIDPVERKSIAHGFSSAQSPAGPYGPIEMVLMMSFDKTVST